MNIEVENCVLVENGAAYNPMGFSPASVSHTTAHKYYKLSKSLIVGSSPSFDCDRDTAMPSIHRKSG